MFVALCLYSLVVWFLYYFFSGHVNLQFLLIANINCNLLSFTQLTLWDQEAKSSAKDDSVPTSKSSIPSKAMQSDSKSASTPTGPVAEEEIRAFILQKAPVTTQDLVAKFKARLKSPEVLGYSLMFCFLVIC